MNRKQYLLLVVLAIGSGLVGGALSSWAFVTKIVAAQEMKHLTEFFSKIAGDNSKPFWSIVQTLAIVSSLFLIYRQIRLYRSASMIQTLDSRREDWDSERMIGYRRTTCRGYQEGTRRIKMAEGEVLGFFEEMGLLLRKGVVSQEFVWETYSYYIEHYWPMLEANIREYRNSTGDDTWFENFQHLADSMQEYSKKRKCPTRAKTEEEISNFISGELENSG